MESQCAGESDYLYDCVTTASTRQCLPCVPMVLLQSVTTACARTPGLRAAQPYCSCQFCSSAQHLLFRIS